MIDLAVRDTVLRELMDDADGDLEALRRTYAQFRVLNRLVAGWAGRYRRHLRPLLRPDRMTTLLDVGCGGGDLARSLARWARRDGLLLDVTAVDPDPRAYAYATASPAPPGVRFRACGSAALVAEGARFHVVVSNHLLHHLDARELAGVLADSEALATRLVLHSDLARRRWSYAAFAVLSRAFGSGSFLRTDGLRSIRRSYRPDELRAAVGAGWRVTTDPPARVLLAYEVPGG